MTDSADEAEAVARAVAGLVALIRAAPKSKIDAIAQGDSYASPADDAKHLAALREVVQQLDCRLDRQPDNSWWPREPVELVSYGVDGCDDEVVAVANALLMISDLETDKFGYMDYRWTNSPGEAFFRSLPERLGAPLLAGFRVLHDRQTRRGW